MKVWIQVKFHNQSELEAVSCTTVHLLIHTPYDIYIASTAIRKQAKHASFTHKAMDNSKPADLLTQTDLANLASWEMCLAVCQSKPKISATGWACFGLQFHSWLKLTEPVAAGRRSWFSHCHHQ